MKYILYPHGGCGNRGCEAIVRSSLKILARDCILFSSKPQQDFDVSLDKICAIQVDRKPISRFSYKYWKALLATHLRSDKNAFDKAYFAPIFSSFKTGDIALSIGGDNYCYGVPEFIFTINTELRRLHIPTVLWGCSIEPSAMDAHMLQDLSAYRLIVARESITYEALRSKGIKQATLYPDPAFQLNRCDLPLPNGFAENNTVGINISPMIIENEARQGSTMANYRELIAHIISKTDMQVALIPHVIWDFNDDRIPLAELYQEFKDSKRVILLDGYKAEEIKGYIARCRFLVAARTHASIAAYSQSVPTLVIGYSVKALGIAKDIFGTHGNYVLPVQSLRSKEMLRNKFQYLLDNENSIREHYRAVMPAYKEKAMQAKTELESIILNEKF